MQIRSRTPKSPSRKNKKAHWNTLILMISNALPINIELREVRWKSPVSQILSRLGLLHFQQKPTMTPKKKTRHRINSLNNNIPWIPMISENLPVLMAFTKGQCYVSHASLWGLQWPVAELRWSVADRHQAFLRCNCKGRSENCCHSWNSSYLTKYHLKKIPKKGKHPTFQVLLLLVSGLPEANFGHSSKG